MNSDKHDQIIRERNTRAHRIVVLFRQLFFLALLLVGIWELNKNRDVLTSVSFFGAAIVVSLQHFISSFFAFLYIRGRSEFDISDIIRVNGVGGQFLGEVRKIGIFFTTLREVDDELMFTGKIISFPNNFVFLGGVSNFTKKDLLFWHQFSINVQLGETPLNVIHDRITSIIHELYVDLLTDGLYENSQARTSTPKIHLDITDQGIKIHVRILVHFYRVTETNNAIMIALTNAHQSGKISLLKHKDYNWIQIQPNS